MQFNNHESDLYILPDSDKENTKITDYLKSHDKYYQISYSDVKDQSWFGKFFIDVPFNYQTGLKEKLSEV